MQADSCCDGDGFVIHFVPPEQFRFHRWTMGLRDLQMYFCRFMQFCVFTAPHPQGPTGG
jgi:hypothetical protein